MQTQSRNIVFKGSDFLDMVVELKVQYMNPVDILYITSLMYNIDFIDKNTYSLNTFNSKPLFQAKPESNTFVWV